MHCAVGTVRPLSARAGVHLQGRAGLFAPRTGAVRGPGVVVNVAFLPPEAPNAMTAASARPRLGVFKFASCDGCQLSLLDCEDELLAVADRVEIAYFLEATRRPLEGEFDVALVEGSVSTPVPGGGDPRHPPAEPIPDHPGRLRLARRHPGPAQLRRPRRGQVAGHRVCLAPIRRDTGLLPAHPAITSPWTWSCRVARSTRTSSWACWPSCWRAAGPGSRTMPSAWSASDSISCASW